MREKSGQFEGKIRLAHTLPYRLAVRPADPPELTGWRIAAATRGGPGWQSRCLAGGDAFVKVKKSVFEEAGLDVGG